MAKTYQVRDDAVSPPQQSLGSAPTLAEVINEGNDADGIGIVNLADPSDDQDAATKAYVDAAAPTLAAVLIAGADPEGTLISSSQDISFESGTLARVTLSPDGTVQLLAALGTLTLSPDGGIKFERSPLTPALTILADGTLNIGGSAGDALTILPDGTVTVGSGDLLTLNADFSFSLNGAQWIEGLATGLFLHLPTADPAVAGATWAGAGIVRTGNMVIPELPATPTEQDIADVLVALGLVTQAV